jgi:hypothetical protein
MLKQIPLKRIIWDYDVNADELRAFLEGEEKQFHHFTREMLYVRILERLSWYEMLDCLPISLIKRMLNPETLSMLRSESMRQKYDYAARILHKQALPPSRWDHPSVKKHTCVPEC